MIVTWKDKSQAELIQSYQKGTPEMFSSKQQNAGASRSRHRSVSPGAVRITIPHTRQLSTRGTIRPVAVLSREEQELKEQKARQFKVK